MTSTEIIVDVRHMLLNKASIIQNFNQFLEFYFAYLSNYMPVLEFAVECLPENSIAKLGNFGMLIDHVSAIQLDRIISLQNTATINEIVEKTKRPKAEISKIFNNIAIAQKVQLSSQILLSSSISRDLLLSTATSKFNPINKIIAWSNILSNVIDFPALAGILIDEDILLVAEKELKDAMSLIKQKGRHYDHTLAKEWFSSLELSICKIQEIPKFFIGSKLAWLQAMEGLEIGKCLLTNDVAAGKRALIYNEKILTLLSNKNFSKNEWPYRTLTSSGPCCDIKEIIKNVCAGEETTLSIIDSHTIFLQSNKKQFFLIIPSIFGFYTNPNMKIQVTEDISIPLSHDINAIIAFYKNPAYFVANNIKSISTPEESCFFIKKRKDRETINKILKDSTSIITKLAITFGDNINKPIAKLVGKVCTTTFDGLMMYGMIYGLEGIAKSKGLPIESPLWSQTRLTITGILVSKMSILGEFLKRSSKEGEAELRKKVAEENILITFEDKMRTFYGKIEESQKEFSAIASELSNSGLNDVMKISMEIREILLSGISLEEINLKLKEYFSSIQDTPLPSNI